MFFIFMQFSGKFDQQLGWRQLPFRVGVPHWEILDLHLKLTPAKGVSKLQYVQCRSVIAPISLICMSTHKASARRCLLKPPSHIQATCHQGIATNSFKKAHPKCALHYGDCQLPDHLYISPRITSIKGIHQC